MELTITTQMLPGSLPEIQWNNEELKKEISAKAEEYKNTAYTEEQSKEMKNDKATLNKLVAAFEDQRKQVKRFYSGPYEKFEGQVKEVLLPVREAIGIIDGNLAEIERKYRLDKKERMRQFYEENVGELRGIVSFEKTMGEDYFKRAYTDKRLKQAYIDRFKRIREDMQAIDELPERFRDKALLRYAESLSLSEALREGKRLEELERAIEERKRKQEEQKRLAAQDQILKLDFRAWGTKVQLMGLRQYMIDNNIRFGKVE